MPIQPTKNLISIFGTVIWGDIAELTTYRRPDGRIVVFAKTYPDKPPSADQLAQRTALATAAAAWKALTLNQRSNWNTAARKASLCMHGYDLWIYWQLTGDDATLLTIERQTATDLIP